MVGVSALIYLLVVTFLCLSSLLKSDPLKSSLGLLGIVVSSACYYSSPGPVYLSYYLVLLMLSGVLVVVVTITSLSKFKTRHQGGVSAFLVGVSFCPGYLPSFGVSGCLFEVCSWDYLAVFILLFLVLFLLLIVRLYALWHVGVLEALAFLGCSY